MRSYYSDNVLFLKDTYPSIYEVIRNFERDTETYRLNESRNGLPNIEIKTETGAFSLYSQYDPMTEAQRWVESIRSEVANAKNVLLFGFGFGYHAEAFVQQFPDKRLYIYEPDIQIFKAAVEVRKLKPILNKETIGAFAIGDGLHVYLGLLDIVAKTVTDSFLLLAVPVYQRKFKNLFQEMLKEASKLILAHRGNLATYFKFQFQWTHNVIMNFPHVVRTPGLSMLEGVCKDVPAIIVGSGPSLGEDLPVLKRLKGRCMIIAAGTSVQALVKHGIIPDLAVSIDGGEPNYRAFKDIDLTAMPFLYCSTVHAKILDKPIKAPIYVHVNSDSLTPYLLGERFKFPQFITTASVTGTAIQAAVYLGCNPIIFTGQDMSYPNDSFYTEGVDHIEKEVLISTVQDATESVENVTGGTNKTTKKMLNTLYDIERLLQLFPGKTFYNASRYGAKIKGTEFMPLEKWAESLTLSKREEQWFLELVSGLKQDPELLSYGTSRMRELTSQLRRYSERLDEFGHCFEALKQASNNSDSIRVVQLLQKVQTYWSELTGSELFQKVISFSLQGNLLIFTRYVGIITNETDPMKKAKLIITHISSLVELMRTVTTQMIQWTELTVEELQSLKDREGNLNEHPVSG